MFKTFRPYVAGVAVALSSLFGTTSANAQQVAMANTNDAAITLADDGGNGAPAALQASPKEMFGNANTMTIVTVGSENFVSIGGKYGFIPNLNAEVLEAAVKASKDAGTFERDSLVDLEFSVIEESRFNGLAEMLKPRIDSGELTVTTYELPINGSYIERQGGSNYSVTGSNLQPVDKLPTAFAALAKTVTTKTNGQTTAVGMAMDDASNTNGATAKPTATGTYDDMVRLHTTGTTKGAAPVVTTQQPVASGPVVVANNSTAASGNGTTNLVVGDSNTPVTTGGDTTAANTAAAQKSANTTSAAKAQATIFDGNFSGQILIDKSGNAYVLTDSKDFPIGSIPGFNLDSFATVVAETANVGLFTRDNADAFPFLYQTGNDALVLAKTVQAKIDGGEIQYVGTFNADGRMNVERDGANELFVTAYNIDSANFAVGTSNSVKIEAVNSTLAEARDGLSDLIYSLSPKPAAKSNSGVYTSSDGMAAGDALGMQMYEVQKAKRADKKAAVATQTPPANNDGASSTTNVGMEPPPVDQTTPSNAQPAPAAQPANDGAAAVIPFLPAANNKGLGFFFEQANGNVNDPTQVPGYYVMAPASEGAANAAQANSTGNANATDAKKPAAVASAVAAPNNDSGAGGKTPSGKAANTNTASSTAQAEGTNWFGWIASGVAAVFAGLGIKQHSKIKKLEAEKSQVMQKMELLEALMIAVAEQGRVNLATSGLKIEADPVSGAKRLVPLNSGPNVVNTTRRASATTAAVTAGLISAAGLGGNPAANASPTSEPIALVDSAEPNVTYVAQQQLSQSMPKYDQTLVSSFGTGQLVANGNGYYTLLQNQLANQRQA